MQTAGGRQKGIKTQRFLVLIVESGNENAALYSVLALRERRIIQNEVFCEERFGKIQALYVHFTYKDVDRFRNRSVHELYYLTENLSSKQSSCSTRCHEITKLDYENTEKKLWLLT